MPPLPPRRAELNDVETVVRLVNLAFLAERPYIEGERINPEGVREMLAKGTFLLAEQEDELVGCVFVSPQGKRAHLGLVSVERLDRAKAWVPNLWPRLKSIAGMPVIARWNCGSSIIAATCCVSTSARGLPPDVPRIKMPFHFVQMCKSLD